MPTPLAVPPEVWEEIKHASIAGVEDERLAKEYGVSRVAIRAKRSREKWATKTRVEIEQEKARRALQEARSTLADTLKPKEGEDKASSQVTTAAEMIGRSIAEMGEVYPLIASRYVLSKLEETVTKDLLPAPDTWKAMAVADSILRKNLGLDKPETQVNLSLWSSQSVQPERDVTPSSAVDVDDELLK